MRHNTNTVSIEEHLAEGNDDWIVVRSAVAITHMTGETKSVSMDHIN